MIILKIMKKNKIYGTDDVLSIYIKKDFIPT